MRRALYMSRNLAAVHVGLELGPQAIVDQARRFGLTTPIPAYPSIHIGAADVYPIEMIGAYGVFATLGFRTTPHAILRVENANGEVLWQHRPTSQPVLSAEEAWLMVDMMKDVVQRGTAYRNTYGAGFRVPAGGKTGTTNDGADVWFIGYTADLVAGVWMGFDQPKRIKANAQGGELAAPAWTAFMKEAYQRRPEPPDWPRPRPETLVARQIDGSSGLLAGPFCSSDAVYTEWFIPGTEPFEECGWGSPYDDPFAVPGDTAGGATTPPSDARPPGGRPRQPQGQQGQRDSVFNPFRLPPPSPPPAAPPGRARP
jgi:penicillin-binding protein 1A